MASYRVTLSDPDGRTVETSLTAPSLPGLALRLRAEGREVVAVRLRQPARAFGGYWRRISEGEFTTFLRQLAVSLDHGVSLGNALEHLVREAKNPVLQSLLVEVQRAVNEGEPLSAPLAAYPRLFPLAYLRLLEAGEASGKLPDVLRQIADYAERAGQTSMKVRSALVYPQIVGGLTLLMLGTVFYFVVPKFVALFQELGVKDLPAATVMLLWFRSVGLPVLLLLFPIALALFYLYETRFAMTLMNRPSLFSRLPVLGPLHYEMALQRLTGLLAALLRGAVPLPEALRLAGQGCENPLLQGAMWDAIPAVSNGESMSTAFNRSGVLPETYCGRIAAAEATGDVIGALQRLADYQATRVDYLTSRAAALLEPLFILLLASLAGWVAAGLFLPMIAIIQSLSGGNQ